MKKPMGELALIEQIRAASRASQRGPRQAALALGIGDDCAILRPPRGSEVLITTDFSLEGRHFRRDLHPAESVGHRCLARGLSDLAAMGARPMAAFLSLALPADLPASAKGRRWIDRFFRGLRALADDHRVPLAGGDTSESPCGLVLADIVLVGSAEAGRALRRSGARPGDALYVTGRLGGSAAELEAALEGRRTAGRKPIARGGAADHPHFFPQPRIEAGRALLRRRLATAAIDLSDGLSTDLTHLCQESGVGAEAEGNSLPIHPLALKGGIDRAMELALNGGEDYELLFSASPSARVPRSLGGIPVTRIGRITRAKSISLIEPTGRRRTLTARGWEHFTAR